MAPRLEVGWPSMAPRLIISAVGHGTEFKVQKWVFDAHGEGEVMEL
jgi:hypothetical protein